MLTRRLFIKQASAVSIAAASPMAVSHGHEKDSPNPQGPTEGTGRRTSARPKAVVRREETIVRYDISGDNWHMSWAADGHQYVSRCDGYNWFDSPKPMYNSRLLAITDGPRDAQFKDVPGYPELNPPAYENIPRYYGFGTLTLDSYIYQFLSTPNHIFTEPDARFIGAKLIYSTDNGKIWRNQDGSTPVIWESWQQRSRGTMVFLEEDQEAFSLLSILQMGRNYSDNRDGFVYVYAPNGNVEGTMNELVLFRVPKSKLLDRTSYEYYAGPRTNGIATWAPDINARAVVHTFPRGWVNTRLHPFSWQPSVVYNAPLDVYMMANWGNGCSADGLWFDKPSYLGIWIAHEPWGPWEQIHEESAWMPAGESVARAFAPQIAPKWLAPDGRSFWLVWSDFQVLEATLLQEHRAVAQAKEKAKSMTSSDWLQRAAMLRKHQPYYTFNTQRVDLVT